jgi:hypothetical protein
MGMSAQSSMTFVANGIGARSSYDSLAENMCNYRSGTVSGQTFFNDKDRDKQAKAGA